MIDFDEILPELVVGSHPQRPKDVEQLHKKLSVAAVLNLQTDEDFQRLGVDWPGLCARYRERDIAVERMPIRDFDTADLRRKLAAAVDRLHRLVDRHRRVYLHCTLGIGRAPTVAVAYLAWSYNWRLDLAWRHVRDRRPCSPSFEAIWLANRERGADAKAQPAEG